MKNRLSAWAAVAICAGALAGCGPSNSSSTPSAPSPAPVPAPPSPPRPTVDLTGNYTVTLEADRSCNELPDALKTRTYEAVVGYSGRSQDGTRDYFSAALSGASFDSYYRNIYIGVIGTAVYFDFSDNLVVEEPEPGTYLTIFGGSERATVDPANLSVISTNFDGDFLYCVTDSELTFPFGCPANAIAYGACRSKNSRWTLTRR